MFAKTGIALSAICIVALFNLSCGRVEDSEPIHTSRMQILFEDNFENALKPDWSWLREDPTGWRVRERALEIRIEPGHAHTVTNALVLDAPDRTVHRQYAVYVTVTMDELTEQYEQAGITWYNDSQPVFKLVKEIVNGKLVIIPGMVPMEEPTVRLRLVIDGNQWKAQYQPNAQGPFITADTGQLPEPANDQVSIQCYHGPAHTERWVRFENFRIQRRL